MTTPWIDFKTTQDLENLISEGDKLFKQADELWQKGQQQEARPIFAKAHEFYDQAKKPTLELAQKLLSLLEEFYDNRQVPH